MRIVDLCEPLWKHSGPGNFNDMDMLQVGIVTATGYALRDLWQRKTLATDSRETDRSFTVPSHGVVFLRIKGKPGGKLTGFPK
jgi:hypothetical protein